MGVRTLRRTGRTSNGQKAAADARFFNPNNKQMSLQDRYTPIMGAEGENRLTLDAGVETLTLPTESANGATVAALGANVLYTVNGQDPSSNFGRPIPAGDEIILTNREMIQNFRVIKESDTATLYVQFYINA